MKTAAPRTNRWLEAWPDALAFALGLGMAWWFRWATTDLVWSLWLSSFCVGYALIIWIVTAPMREIVIGMWRDRRTWSFGFWKPAAAVAIIGVGTLFGLAFFTVHFGGFHWGHSMFLGMFFPLEGKADWPGWSMYREVAVRYWWFLPAAFLAERGAFRSTYVDPDTSVTAEAIAKRKAKGSTMMLPYKNVIRMHLLIFFFFFAHVVKLENFIVYAVVYAVYFFPWRLLKKKTETTVAVAA
jgi:hypothetical protein